MIFEFQDNVEITRASNSQPFLSPRGSSLPCFIRSFSGIEKLKHPNSAADKLAYEMENVHLEYKSSLYSHLSNTPQRST